MYPKTLVWGALLALRAAFVDAITVSGTILIFAQDEATSTAGTSGLRGYGIPYETLIVPEEGAELPELTTSEEEGNYGGFIVLNEVGYEYDNGFRSALTDEQWEAIHEYQLSFGVRLVHLNVFPSEEYGMMRTIRALLEQELTEEYQASPPPTLAASGAAKRKWRTRLSDSSTRASSPPQTSIRKSFLAGFGVKRGSSDPANQYKRCLAKL